MKTSVERLVDIAFLAALLLLCTSAIVAHVAKDAVVAETQSIHEASGLLGSLANLRAAVLADESAGRGFAATGDEAFLRRNAGAQAQARAELAAIEAAVAQLEGHDPDAPARLEELVSARFARTEAIVAARREGGPEAAAALIATRRGLQLTEAILDACAELQAVTETRLASARAAADARALTASQVSAAALGLGIATLLLASLLIRARMLAARNERELMASVVAVVHAADEAIIGKTADGIVRSWNAGAEKLYGWSAAEITGRSIETVVPGDRLAELQAIMDRVRRGERVGPIETDRVRRDGTRIRVSLNLSPVLDASGAVVGVATIARDATAAARDTASRAALIAALRAAATRADALSDMLPTCAWCKAVRDEAGRWRPLEVYLREQADVQFTHGICPACAARLKSESASSG